MAGVEAERRGGGLTPAKLGPPLQVTKILIASFLVIGGLLTITPTATAQATATETFDTYTSGALPCRPNPTFAQPCTGDYYDYSHVTGAFQVTGATFDGASGKSFHATGLAAFDSTSALCSEPVSFAIRVPTSFNTNAAVITTPTSPGAGNSQYLIALVVTTTTEGASATAKLTIDRYQNSGTSAGQLSTGTLTFTNSFAAATFYHFSIYCQTGAAAGTIVLVSPEAQALGNAPVSVAYLANTGTNFIEMTRFRVQGLAAASGIYIDTLQTATPFAPSPGSIFCANPAETDFGYEYVEGASYQSSFSQVGIGIDDGFLFTGDSGNSEYLAKGFSTGTEALSVKMKLEAASDGASSIFRAAFTTGATAPPSVTNKGDGKDGGNFDNHVGVRFEEDGGAWIIGIYQNVGGAGYNRIGSAVNYGDPDNPTNFNFTVDTRTLVANLSSEGNLLLTRTIDSSFQDVPMKDQWFVGTGGTFAVDANTILDDADQSDNDDSTCIFDLIGGAVATGSGGLSPGSSIPDAPTPTTPEGFDDLSESFGNVFGGIGATGGAVFLGIFWILIFAAGAYGILGGSPLAIGIGALCGFVFSIFTGLIPDILVFVVVLLAGAAVGMRLFGGGGSGADG